MIPRSWFLVGNRRHDRRKKRDDRNAQRLRRRGVDATPCGLTDRGVKPELRSVELDDLLKVRRARLVQSLHGGEQFERVELGLRADHAELDVLELAVHF